MNDTKDGFEYIQLHIEDYLQRISAEQKELELILFKYQTII